jgi:hypothetical protein
MTGSEHRTRCPMGAQAGGLCSAEPANWLAHPKSESRWADSQPTRPGHHLRLLRSPRYASPVGTMAALSTIRMTARFGARVRCLTPLGTTNPCCGCRSIERSSRSTMKCPSEQRRTRRRGHVCASDTRLAGLPGEQRSRSLYKAFGYTTYRCRLSPGRERPPSGELET